MSNPSEIMARIQRRRQSDPPRRQSAPRVPAPAPATGLTPAAPSRPPEPVPAPEQRQPPVPAPEVRRVAPRPSGGHALYTQLMRSHDRMGTRHLERK